MWFLVRLILPVSLEFLTRPSKLCIVFCGGIACLIPTQGIAGDLAHRKQTEITRNMIWVESGRNDSRKPDEFKNSFWIDKFEVTQKDFSRIMGANPSYFIGAERPVEKVTWYEARKYCEKTGKRLPKEWEWEKAIRAGISSKFYWKDGDPKQYAWYKGNANKQTHPVGQKKPNAWGIFDMAGNVWEWTLSDHESGGKVVRGGSWRNGVNSLKSSHRINSLPIHKFHYVGFRCAASELKE